MLFSAICLISMHLMLLADVNKYVGVSIGGGILITSFVLYMIFRKTKNLKGSIFLFIFASAIGCGLAISSLYTYIGTAPAIKYSLYIWCAYAILFLSYCLLTNIPLFKRFPRICLVIYGLIVLTGDVVGIIISSKIIFSLTLMMFILFIAYLATILAHSSNYAEHNNTLALVSFVGLFFVVIIVLLVISEGDGLDGIDFDAGGGRGSRRDNKRNPYGFI